MENEGSFQSILCLNMKVNIFRDLLFIFGSSNRVIIKGVDRKTTKCFTKAEELGHGSAFSTGNLRPSLFVTSVMRKGTCHNWSIGKEKALGKRRYNKLILSRTSDSESLFR